MDKKSEFHVLIVEDDPDDYLLTSDLLKEISGIKVIIDWARSFEQGREMLRPCSHDAVLLDYRLGKADGLLLLREALEQGCKAPIILLTGQDDRDLALQALEAGAADYLVKGTIDVGLLERSIRYALQKKRNALELEDKVAQRTAALEEANAALRESEQQIRALLSTAEAARLSAEAAKIRAEAATRAKDDFLAALSHELRTPLNPALLLATSLAEDAELPERVRKDIDVIAQGIALQARLVDDLLDLTSITGGKLRLEIAPLDAHASLHRVQEILRADIEAREIKLALNLEAPRPWIKADAVRVQQIFWNVLKNAIKFTPIGGAITVRTANPKRREEMLEVEITDTGIGIAPEMRDRIFDAFIQEEHEQGHRFGGIGLGLAITQRLVGLQHGRIEAESEGRDRGATFRIELPLVAAGEIPGAMQSPNAVSARASTPRRILLVEDHDQTRATMAQLLERRGHTVDSAPTAEVARAKAASGVYDLLISDLGLPDGDGHQLMAELHRRYGFSGIALSGYGMDDDVARSRASGFCAHLTKPVDIRALESAIATAPHHAGGERETAAKNSDD